MKKFLYCIFIFVCVFLFSVFSEVSAKSVTKDSVTISFDDDDVLNMAYRNIYTFKILEDKSFYFNGVKHTFNENYTLVDNSISVSNNRFSLEGNALVLDLNNNLVVSSNRYQAYGFRVNIDILEGKEYTFTQVLCYRYGDVEECNEDKDDKTIISEDVESVFYYDFLPFYSDDISFDYITYKFKMENESESIIFDDITFVSSEINYKDFFTIQTYDYSGYYNSRYDGKNYVLPSKVDGETLFVEAVYYPGATVDATRRYKVTFSVCVGDDYSICKEVDKYDSQSNSALGRIYTLPLANVIYDSENISVNYDSFKLKGTYVCNSDLVNNCSSTRSENVLTSIESEIYYLNLIVPTLKDSLKGVSLSGCGSVEACYGVNTSVTNKFEFIDDNNIVSIHYLISDEMINNSNLIVDTFINGSEITLDKEEGLYYIYFKIIDDIGIVTYYIYGYLFDFTSPHLIENNFNDYNENFDYNSISISVSFKDDKFASSDVKVYYLISDYLSEVGKEDVVSANKLYSSKLVLEDLVSDGSHKVCFVSMEPLGNYSDVICSNQLNLDTTPLVKEEVSVNSDNSNYQKSVSLNIKIDDLEDNASFKCGLFLDYISINSENELSRTCYNNSENIFNNQGENEYKLWIYASDKAGNYSLLELDRIYYIDNKAPSVSYVINGDISKYSNDVVLDVSVNDLNDIALSSLSYQFYLNSYNENNFMSLDLDKGISYPYDYYGTYKLAIKACDVVNNCKINTYQDIFYIDTGEIKIELLGKDTVTILRWGKYNESGVSASKGNSGKYRIELDYNIEGSVDTGKVGVYYLTYSCGEGMNRVSVVRKVIVKDSVPYIIILGSLLFVGEIIILLRLFIKKRKNDSI